MKKKKLQVSLRIALTICAAWGWWGMIYPELTMTADTYRIVNETSDHQMSGDDIYEILLHGERSKIRFSSRFLKEWNEFSERGSGKNRH